MLWVLKKNRLFETFQLEIQNTHLKWRISKKKLTILRSFGSMTSQFSKVSKMSIAILKYPSWTAIASENVCM